MNLITVENLVTYLAEHRTGGRLAGVPASQILPGFMAEGRTSGRLAGVAASQILPVCVAEDRTGGKLAGVPACGHPVCGVESQVAVCPVFYR